MPSFMSGSKNVHDINNRTYCYICLITIGNIINTSNLYNRANSFLSCKRQRKCQCDPQSHLSQYAETPLFMSGCKNVDEFVNQTYCYICLTTV